MFVLRRRCVLSIGEYSRERVTDVWRSTVNEYRPGRLHRPIMSDLALGLMMYGGSEGILATFSRQHSAGTTGQWKKLHMEYNTHLALQEHSNITIKPWSAVVRMEEEPPSTGGEVTKQGPPWIYPLPTLLRMRDYITGLRSQQTISLRLSL